MNRVKLIALLLLIFGIMSVPAYAQNATPTPSLVSPGPTDTINPDANINWPPPVYVLRGTTDIRGSANLPNMLNYFLDYRLLGPEMIEPEENEPWISISLPTSNSVSNDVLASWDTTVADDGVYEIRLTVNLTDGEALLMIVRPVRVENNPPPFVQVPSVPTPVPLQPATALPTNPPLPTQPPPATIAPTQDNIPRATVNVPSGNVRQGDSTVYPVVTTVKSGDILPIVGLSSTGSTWLLVDLPIGGRGWIAPSLVTISGSTAGLPRVAPPPPPFTPTPIPPTGVPATAVPPTSVSSANLIAGIVRISPNPPVCDETFTVNVDIANFGGEQTKATGSFMIQDIVDGQVQAQTSGPIQLIDNGKTVRSPDIPLTVSTNEDDIHTILVTVNPDGGIPETTRDDNKSQITYRLGEGEC